jgi:uncharacterized protein YggU (UPF0235/DUF167 family)
LPLQTKVVLLDVWRLQIGIDEYAGDGHANKRISEWRKR